MQSLYARLLKAGCKIDNHESDLYVQNSQIARDIITAYNKEHKYSHPIKFKMFKSNLDGDSWLDIPFMYSPYWDKKQGRLI